MDAALGAGDAPDALGGLAFGAVHEWFGLGRSAGAADGAPVRGQQGRKPLSLWRPALSVMVHLARRAVKLADGGVVGGGAVLWIGRRVWPYGHALLHSGEALFRSSICVDARDADERFWAVDVALRAGAAGGNIVVVADGSTLPLALSRRLQLAAESGSALAILARPPWEEAELSAAMTRWRVSTAPACEEAAAPQRARNRHGGFGAPVASGPRWSVSLLRCKDSRSHAVHAQEAWTVERSADGSLVAVSPGVAERSRAPALAS